MQQKVSIQINHFRLPLIDLKTKIKNSHEGQTTNRTQGAKRKLQKNYHNQQKKYQKINKQDKNMQKRLSEIQNFTLIKKKGITQVFLPKLQKRRSRFQNQNKNKSIKSQSKAKRDYKKQLRSVKSSSLSNNLLKEKKKYIQQKRQSNSNMFDKIHNTLLQSKFHKIKKNKENALSLFQIKEKINRIKKNIQKYKNIQSQSKIEDSTKQLIPVCTRTQWKKIKIKGRSVVVNKSCVIEQIQQIDRLLLKNQNSLIKLLQNKKLLVDMQLNKENLFKKIR